MLARYFCHVTDGQSVADLFDETLNAYVTLKHTGLLSLISLGPSTPRLIRSNLRRAQLSNLTSSPSE
jgi:hypothetical protein